ncbi:MAG: alpha/beta fold hydrolase [Candidatus Tectomicrobia bacterium]|uniref:Alpha/beta fold hydrolase n=1 Tax=Tectimicrobiota bacterium TaxID=2528274 RepID=A0A937W2G4_UNCTE|nr:alpha/beta fold hydrolase [Candidatus Tectomicrobia bacterium]
MPMASVNGIQLYYEVTGSGYPLLFCHEFAGDYRSWEPQVRYFSRRYQVITYNARGYPPSDVPETVEAYSQDQATDDIVGLMRHLGLEQAHLVGLSMGGYAVLHFGLRYPELARSLVIAGCGYGSVASERQRFQQDSGDIAGRIERDGMRDVASVYSRGPTRVQFIDKDPRGWREFADQLAEHSGLGAARTMQGVQGRRPSVYALEEQMRRLHVPTLIITGDEDEPCLEPGIFMKRSIPTAGLLVIPKSGHTINLEEPDAFNRAIWDFLTSVEAGKWDTRNPASLSASAVLPADDK